MTFLAIVASGTLFIGRGCISSSSLLAYRHLPADSHVVAGALAAGVLGLFWSEEAYEH